MRRLTQNLALMIAVNALAMTSYGGEAIRWETDLDAAFRQAQSTNRPVLLHFYTDECVPCKRLETTVFNQPRVAGAMNEFFIPVKVDANQRPELADRYGIRSVPNDVILTPGDQELHRMFSPQDPDQYVAQLSAVAFRAGSVKTSRPAAEPVSTALPNGPASDGDWANYNRINNASPDDRYNTDAIYSRDAQADRAWSTEAPATSPVARPAPESEPREVINRFARRGPEEVQGPAGPGEPVASAPQKSVGGSPWESWPNQQAESGAPPETNSLPPHSRYSSNEPNPSMASSLPTSPARRPAAVPQHSQVKPQISMDGYCPVTLIRKNNWVKGDPKYGVIHRGRLYLFTGPEEKEIFFADPDVYSPVLAGIDAVELATAGTAVAGERAHGVVYRKRVYLFSSEANLQQFWEEPERYASPIRQAMESGDVGRLFR